MADNRPMFDDEDLPMWMKNAGITGGGQGNSSPSSGNSEDTSAAGSASSDDLSWLNDAQFGNSASNTENSDVNSGSAAPWDSTPTSGDTSWGSSPSTPPAASGDLPPWMQSSEPAASSTPSNAPDAAPWETGESGGFDLWEQPSSASPASPFGEPASADLPPWASAAPAEDLTPTTPNSSDDFDWMKPSNQSGTSSTPGAQAGFGVTGMLPWRQEAEAAGQGSGFSGQGDFDLFGSGASSADQDDPFGNVGDFDPFADQGSGQAQSSAEEDFDPFAALSASQSTPAVSQPSASDDLSWLDDALQQPPSQPETPTPPAQEPPKPQIKKLGSVQPLPSASQPPEGEPPKPQIKKLGAVQPPAESTPPDQPKPQIRKLSSAQPTAQQPVEPNLSDMTYEEWEQLQHAKEAEAARTDEDRLLDEVPDWFNQPSKPAPTSSSSKGKSAGPSGGDFMPEWFVGQEEQSADDVPDWFKNVDLSATPLVGTTPAPEEPPASLFEPTGPSQSSTGDDIPDWFKGDVAGLNNIDFNAMFVQDTPSTESGLAAKLRANEPQPPVVSQPEPEPQSEQPAAVSDQLPSDQSTSAQALSVEQEAQPEPQAAPSLPTLTDEPEVQSVTSSVEPDFNDDLGALNFDELAQPEQPELVNEPISQLSDNSVSDSSDSNEDAIGTDDSDLDWMSDMPDMDDLLGGVEAASPAVNTEPEPQPASELTPAPIETDAEPDFGLDDLSLNDLDWLSGDAQTPEAESPLPTASQPNTPVADNQPSSGNAQMDWINAMASDPNAVSSGVTSQSFDDSENIENMLGLNSSMGTNAGDVPDWMREMASAGTPSAPTGASELDLEPGDLPDWMRDMSIGAPSAQASEPTTAASTPAPDSMQGSELDWMTDFAASLPSEETGQPTLSPTAAASNTPAMGDLGDLGDIPDWFTETDAQTSVQPSMQATSNIPEPAADLGLSGGDIDIDALLTMAETVAPAEEVAKRRAEESQDLASGDLDLDFDALEAALPPAEPESPYAAELYSPDDLFDSSVPAIPDMYEVGGTSDLNSIFSESGVEAEAERPETTADAAMQPEWVADLRPTEGPVVIRVIDQEFRLSDKPLIQLPEQVRQLRERSRRIQEKLREQSQQPTERSEQAPAGPLAGISGTIQVVPESIQPRIVIGENEPLVVSDLDARRIRVIQNILRVEEQMLRDRALAEDEREEKQAQGIAPKQVTRTAPKIDRFVITLLLAAVLLLPFFTNILNIGSVPDINQLTLDQQKAFLTITGTVDGLSQGQNVVVAFEYGPTASGELDEMASALIRDLIKKSVKPIIVSTNPVGALHAQALMYQIGHRPADLDLMGRTGKPLVARQDYVVLPYLPSGAVGVNAFATAVLASDFNASNVQFLFRNDIEGKPSGLTDVTTANLRTNPTFVLVETPTDVRNWAEQYQSNPPFAPLKMVLLSSASASAAAQTYASSATTRIIGTLNGLHDAMIYESTRQQIPAGKAQTLSDQRWHSISLTILIASFIILIGALVGPIRNIQRRLLTR